MSTLWAAVGGGVVVGLFTLLANWQGRSSEHRQWRRDKRLQAYLAFTSALDHAVTLRVAQDAHTRDVTADEIHNAMVEAQKASREVIVLGPQQVLDAAQVLFAVTTQVVFDNVWDEEKRTALDNAMVAFAQGSQRALRTRK